MTWWITCVVCAREVDDERYEKESCANQWTCFFLSLKRKEHTPMSLADEKLETFIDRTAHSSKYTYICILLGEPNMAMEFALFRCGDFLENRMSEDDKNCHLFAQLSSYFELDFIHAFYTYLRLDCKAFESFNDKSSRTNRLYDTLFEGSLKRLTTTTGVSLSSPSSIFIEALTTLFFLQCCIHELQTVEKYTWLSVVSLSAASGMHYESTNKQKQAIWRHFTGKKLFRHQ